MLHQATATLARLARKLRDRRENRSDPGVFPLRREFGGWAIRPIHGWRSVRGVTPPLAYTRRIPASDRDAAADWAMDRLGIG